MSTERLSYDVPPTSGANPEGYYGRPLVKQVRGARQSLYYSSNSSPNNRSWDGYVTDGRTFGLDSNIYLKSITWVQVFNWDNTESDSTPKFSVTTTKGLVNTTGSEQTIDAGVSAAFMGLGVSFGYSSKTFSSAEVSSSTSVTTEVACDARAKTYVYQKQYEFVTEKLYAVTDANGDRYVKIRGKPTKAYSTQVINADEYLTKKSALTGSGSISPVPVTRKSILYYDVGELDPSSRTTFNNKWLGEQTAPA